MGQEYRSWGGGGAGEAATPPLPFSGRGNGEYKSVRASSFKTVEYEFLFHFFLTVKAVTDRTQFDNATRIFDF